MSALHIGIVIYLILMYVIYITGVVFTTHEIIANKIYLFGSYHELSCICHGGLGSVLYCMRGFYINYCVEEKTNIEKWAFWYLFRPIVGTIMGVQMFLIIKFIIEILNLGFIEKYTFLGLFALSLSAGYKVNKFLGREGKD